MTKTLTERLVTIIIADGKFDLHLPFNATIGDMRKAAVEAYEKIRKLPEQVGVPVRDNGGQLWDDTDIPSEEFCPYYLTYSDAKSCVDGGSFDEAVRPLMKYLSENHHPHTSAIVTSTRAELVEGVAAIDVLDYLKD